MKEILLKDVVSGMTTAEAVKTKSGQVLADKNTTLSKQLIARFTFYHINSIKINDIEKATEGKTDDKKVNIEEEISVEPLFARDHVSFNQKLSLTPEFREFQLSYALCLEDLKRNFKRIRLGEFDVENDKIIEHTSGIFKYRTPLELFNMIRCVRFSEDSIYSHCLNVALEAAVLGKWLKFDSDTIKELFRAALLHDIGKTEVTPEVLNKKGKLTADEFDEIKNHTIFGERILRDAGFDEKIRNAALLHHERFDGSGYPKKLSGNQIDDFASLIALCDVYDAMTSPRPQRSPRCAFEVIEEFEKIGFEKYNTKYLLTFLSHLAGMYHSSMVFLSDGQAVRIVYLNQSKLSRPIVEDEHGNIIDLSREKNRKIVKVL